MSKTAQLDYFYGSEVDQFTFFRVPKCLFTDPRFKDISCEAKLLYGLMLDRMQLSIRKGWFDEQNRAYIQYSVEQIMEDLQCGNKKACNILKELDGEHGVGLIERMRLGLGQANIYYVKNFTTGRKEPEKVDNKGNFQKCQNDTSGNVQTTRQQVSKRHFRKCSSDICGNVQTTPQEMSGGHANKNHSSETDQSDTASVDLSVTERQIEGRAHYERFFKVRFGYDDHMAALDSTRRDMFAQYVELIIDTVSDTCDFVEIGQSRVEQAAVRERFLQLTVYDVLAVMDKVSNYTGERIRNMHKYILTALYREPVTRQSTVAQQVAYDICGGL
ncbi:MAG: replication initiator protein A [Lachnospiraceae bacterium]|nr:replication initiator protein A [Lachnospiraceae bacterium]